MPCGNVLHRTTREGCRFSHRHSVQSPPCLKICLHSSRWWKKGTWISNALGYLIAHKNLPLSFTESKGFLHFCKIVIPLYKPPGRKRIASVLDDNYSSIAAAAVIKKHLMSADHVIVTTDIWTDCMNTTSFLSNCSFFYMKVSPYA